MAEFPPVTRGGVVKHEAASAVRSRLHKREAHDILRQPISSFGLIRIGFYQWVYTGEAVFIVFVRGEPGKLPDVMIIAVEIYVAICDAPGFLMGLSGVILNVM